MTVIIHEEDPQFRERIDSMTTPASIDMTKVSLRNDIIFKYVFGYEKNEKILRALLNAILGFEGNSRIVSLRFLNSINLSEYLKDKFSILDVKAEDNTKKRYNIEIQVRTDSSYIARAIYYHDKLYTGQLRRGNRFEKIHKTISISILNYNLLENERDLHNIYRYANIKTGSELTDLKEMHFIELIKFRKDTPRHLRTKFEKWLHALKFGEKYIEDPEKMPAVLKMEEEIFMAINEMKKASADPKVRELMETREKALHDEASRLYQAKQQGIKEGMEKGKREYLKQLIMIKFGHIEKDDENALSKLDIRRLDELMENILACESYGDIRKHLNSR
jgi:predicted transposase/invertase (TIGR01784 family)